MDTEQSVAFLLVYTNGTSERWQNTKKVADFCSIFSISTYFATCPLIQEIFAEQIKFFRPILTVETNLLSDFRCGTVRRLRSKPHLIRPNWWRDRRACFHFSYRPANSLHGYWIKRRLSFTLCLWSCILDGPITLAIIKYINNCNDSENRIHVCMC